MAAYDFSEKMKVTILYDDSDEDDKDTIILFSEEDLPKNSDESKDLDQENRDDRKRKIDLKQPDSLSTEDAFPEKKVKSTEFVDCDETQSETKKSHGEENIPIKEVVENAKPSSEENNMNNTNTEKTINNNDVNIMRKEFQEVSNYIQDILKTVSEHLILVINAFQEHTRIVNEYRNRVDGNFRIQQSKARYNSIKTHVFHLSYSAVVSVILAQENSTEFIDAFLNNTMKIADKKELKYTPQFIQPFFYDLIFWTKQKRNFMDSQSALAVQKNNETNTDNNPMLTKQLSQPAVVPPSKLTNSLRKNRSREKRKVTSHNSDQSSTCPQVAVNREPQTIPIFRAGPPEREVRISVQPNILQLQTKQITQIASMIDRPPPPYQMPTYNWPENHHHRVNQSIQYANGHVVNNNFAPPNAVVVPPNATGNRSQVTNDINNNSNNQYMHEYQNYHRNSWPPRNMDLPRQYPHLARELHPYYGPHQQDYRNYQPQPVSRDQNHLSNVQKTCEQNLRMVSQNNVAESGRSLSTDSGFISPLQFNSGGSPTEPAAQSPHFAPLITHVTSLNPNVVQIAQGSCHVCGKPSKSKCMGCYLIYYCSYECESADWNRHMYFCKKNKETQ
ncbi:probable basic-leucine zipper transcription factor S [Ostrinia nubilalis]|uniref:probable basic-leucine zipper transcription factor S n=1 Tax=Ostrinia nubilalis TaxID=29057 RepID=UPI0030823C9A